MTRLAKNFMQNNRSRTKRLVGAKQHTSLPPGAIEGKLEGWFETGLEGTVWALADNVHQGHDRLHVIEEDDELTIFDRNNRVLWQGMIRCDRKTGATPRPTNPDFIQQQALGFWIHWIQKGFKPDRWAGFFIRSDSDRLRGLLIKKSTHSAAVIGKQGKTNKPRWHSS